MAVWRNASPGPARLRGGAHPPKEFSLDLLAPVIPGGHWRFADLTQPFWSRLPGNIHESSVHVGVSVIGLAGYTWIRRRRVPGIGDDLLRGGGGVVAGIVGDR